MSFMNSFIGQHKKTKGNIVADDDVEETSAATVIGDEAAEEIGEGSEAAVIPPSPPEGSQSNEIKELQSSTKKGKLSASEMVAGPMIQFLKTRSQQPTTSANPNLKFLESLLPDIEKLSSKRKRVFKYKVIGLLNDLCEEQENEDSLHLDLSVPSSYASTPSPYASAPSPCTSAQYRNETTSTTKAQSFPTGKDVDMLYEEQFM